MLDAICRKGPCNGSGPATGRVVDTIPEKPVQLGSPEANAFRDRIDALHRGLVERESISCDSVR